MTSPETVRVMKWTHILISMEYPNICLVLGAFGCICISFMELHGDYCSHFLISLAFESKALRTTQYMDTDFGGLTSILKDNFRNGQLQLENLFS